MNGSSALRRFTPLTRSWFESSFVAPTPAQEAAWDAISKDRNALVIAPTGSGKTLAGFLWAIDRLVAAGPAPDDERLRVLYISPLKALAVDIERNLRAPLHGVRAAASRAGQDPPDITVGVRTGDTPADERRRMASKPPDILITTPESLFLLLTSQARAALATVETVILDEVHAVAATKRGAHLALSLERLEHLVGRPIQRLGLSATVRPQQEIARFLGGDREVDVVAPGSDKQLEITIEVPVEDMAELGRETSEPALGPAPAPEERSSIWPHVHERLRQLIRSHRSTIVFVNSRRLAERLCAALNDLAAEGESDGSSAPVARAHHGSVSREQRMAIEEALKAGTLPAVVATSSLELGIDMGAVDLVVQVEAPASVASGLQRIGRAGHHVGAVSSGVIFPKYRGDLLPSAVAAERMREGQIEEIHYPRNTLDVLAQQIVAMAAMDEWEVGELERVVRRAAPFAELPRSGLEAVLDMLAGRYPSNEFAELRPRINWDRVSDRITGRRGAQRLAVTSGGTIPDRGLFGVFLAGEGGGRVGELDEEMVYESRVGEVFLLGSSSWLIEDITHDRVVVSPAPGQPGKMPFWHGDAPGRPLELGRALGAYVRGLQAPDADRVSMLRACGMDGRATANLIAYLDEQKEVTTALPDDRTIVVERFRDELGDWRLCIHSMFGAQVHAPWALAIEARLREQLGVEVQCIYTDDGIIVKLPDTGEETPEPEITLDPDEVEDAVVDVVHGSAMFASRFRECAGRALLLPRRRPGSRTPLWQQRQKSAFLLQVASRYGSFPIVLEALRECLQDVFDVPGLVALMRDIASRRVRVVQVSTTAPSPFASSLQFGFISAFMYEGDAPLAEKRAQALSLDRSLLAEIMGREELRELIDEDSLEDIELELQLLAGDRKVSDPDGMHDALRLLGDLTTDEAAARSADASLTPAWLDELEASRRALRVLVGGEQRWIAIEDAARYRDALGTAPPPGVPQAFLEPTEDPLADIVGRWAARHGPFRPPEVAARFALGVAVVETALERLAAAGRVVRGEFRPGGSGIEWVDAEVLRRIKRRSLAAFRKEVEPAEPAALARFYLAWQGIGPHAGSSANLDATYRIVEQLTGAPVPATVLERQVLRSRLPGYRSTLMDELGTAGEVVWCGAGAIGSTDGYVCLAPAAEAALLPDPVTDGLSGLASRVIDVLVERGAMFFRDLCTAAGSSDDTELLLALWEAVWAGWVTNDTLAPLRALTRGRSHVRGGARRRGRGRPMMPARSGPPSAVGRWSLLPDRVSDATRKRHALAERLLDRHGIVTRGVAGVERLPGGFSAVYPVLKAMEEAGRCRRGYFVEGLGGAQFALPGAVDRMRALSSAKTELTTQVLAATDPANPYGAALPWPDADSTHRAGRKAGALVVISNGRLVAFVERGGRRVLGFDDDPELVRSAVDALALSVRDGLVDSLDLETVDGAAVGETGWDEPLRAAGFHLSSRGLRLRA